MPFTTAVMTSLGKWRQFSGRAPRKELFSFLLFAVATFGASFALYAIFPTVELFAIGPLVAWLLLLVPYYAVTVRRLHDSGYNGWTLLIGLFPYVGGFIVLYLLVKPSQAGDNRYGPHPYRPGEVPYVLPPVAAWAPPRADASPGALWSSE